MTNTCIACRVSIKQPYEIALSQLQLWSKRQRCPGEGDAQLSHMESKQGDS